MAMVDLEGVYKVRAKGKVYHYAWRGKGAPRLLSEPGTAAYVAELAAAQAARKGGDKTRLSGLIAMYRASDEWLKLSPKTKGSWQPWLDKIQVKFGELRLDLVDRAAMTPEIRKWRNTFSEHPRSADVALEAFSRVLSFGIAEGKLTRNVVTGIDRLYENNRSDVIWTDDDLAKLETVAAPEIMFAARLAIYTGLRQADVLRLSWSHVQPLAVEIATKKSGEKITALIPLHGKLRALLAEIPKRSTVILTNQSGLPWKTGFNSSWQKTIKRAGIDKHFHDLRGTAATKLFAAGFKIREIATVMGWSEDQVERIIVRYVNRDAVLRDMIRRMDEAEAGTDDAKPDAKPSPL